MSIQDLGAIVELLGSIGVIATLIYLSVQIRQNTHAMDETLRMAKVNALVQRNDVLERTHVQGALSEEMSEIIVKAREDGVSTLSKVEWERLSQWERARIFRIESQFTQWQNGYLDGNFFDYGLKGIILYSAPLWNELGLRVVNPSFRDAIAKLMSEADA